MASFVVSVNIVLYMKAELMLIIKVVCKVAKVNALIKYRVICVRQMTQIWHKAAGAESSRCSLFRGALPDVRARSLNI